MLEIMPPHSMARCAQDYDECRSRFGATGDNVDQQKYDQQSICPATPSGSHTKIKVVLVGDGAIGKTSLVVSYTTNGYPTEYVPTAFDNYTVVVRVDNEPIRLQLCDTAGQDDFDSLRPLCYPGTDVFMICFSVVSPTSYHNIKEKWIPEIRQHCPKTPIILVGTQCDLRNDVKILIELSHYNERPITEADAEALSRQIGAITYIECSALTQKNLKQVFDTAVLATLERNATLDTGRRKGKRGKCKKELWSTPSLPMNLDTKSSKKGWKKLCCMV